MRRFLSIRAPLWDASVKPVLTVGIVLITFACGDKSHRIHQKWMRHITHATCDVRVPADAEMKGHPAYPTLFLTDTDAEASIDADFLKCCFPAKIGGYLAEGSYYLWIRGVAADGACDFLVDEIALLGSKIYRCHAKDVASWGWEKGVPFDVIEKNCEVEYSEKYDPAKGGFRG